MNDVAASQSYKIRSANPEATERLAAAFAEYCRQGTTFLLDGPVGAGKSVFARGFIQHLMAKTGTVDDVPSPTFTIVQTYMLDGHEIWHADLYRLSFFEELIEIGMDTALDRATCLVEWPDRLGPFSPPSAIHLTFALGEGENDRVITLRTAGLLPNAIAKALGGPPPTAA